MKSTDRLHEIEKKLGARLRTTVEAQPGRERAAQMDYLNFEGHVRASRPASKMEIAMWDLLVKGEDDV